MKKSQSIFAGSILFIAGSILVNYPSEAQGTDLTLVEKLGMELYFDENLSSPGGQSCASCHDPNVGFVDPDSELPVSAGTLPNRFGGRNSPSAAYAMYAPMFHFDGELWVGGQFWDGRATGVVLLDPLADQALGPFLNPVEMANNNKSQVVTSVANSSYADDFKAVWGEESFTDTEVAYDSIALSIAAFERTALFAPFTSQYDDYLKECLDRGGKKADCAIGKGKKARNAADIHFSDEEWRGLQLFMVTKNNNDGELTKKEGAMCAACHIAEWTPDLGNVIVPEWSPDGSIPPLFTDFTFDNLGVPKNTEFPLSATSPPDLGLGVVTGDPADNGKVKVMSLRNIGKTGPYAHNGFFKSLKDITHFYNTRDVPGEWPMPEYPATINTTELGNIGLSEDDENALVAFMKTLSDN